MADPRISIGQRGETDQLADQVLDVGVEFFDLAVSHGYVVRAACNAARCTGAVVRVGGAK